MADPAATKLLMSTLSQRIKRVRDFNVPTGVVSQSDALGVISNALDRAVAQSRTGAVLVANLSSLRTDLELLTIVFGCEFVTSSDVGGETKPLAIRKKPGAEQADVGMPALSDPMVLGGGALGLLAVMAAILARLALHGRGKREVCNTPVLVSINDRCTMTRIVDINRNGMKIEAASIHEQDDWVDLYFCGHNCRGKIKWKNEYFAGVRFQKRISPTAVTDILEKSQSSLEESGLGMNATPCFSLGCHEGCGKHCPSAMTERTVKTLERSYQQH
ncbi:hypothetical protein [Aliiroseovarius pelagivivens]|uniref:hypothetical protein n=1 Tax=Aliiroseovarius pelagivivens TaxID=1639690 RepID=UPI0011B279BE|nr:hypothetical protein [Aliiroseovarius pelagivivens]